MPSVHVRLDISPDRFLDYYRGRVRAVYTTSAEGTTVRFPASVLQRFVTPEGIHGQFLLTYDDSNKFVRLERLSG